MEHWIIAPIVLPALIGPLLVLIMRHDVVLQRVGPINDVVVPRDLKDPIVIDDPANMDAIFKATFTKDIVRADLFIYCTWDIVYSTSTRPAGSTQGNMCFVENQLNGRIGELLSAHEVGHALGLPHTEDNLSLLMTSGGINNDLLDMRDIETANPQ